MASSSCSWGRLPTGNGRPCERAQRIAGGDRIEVAERVFIVESSPAPGHRRSYGPREIIPAPVLRPMVWPRDSDVTCLKINVHVTRRCRICCSGAD